MQGTVLPPDNGPAPLRSTDRKRWHCFVSVLIKSLFFLSNRHEAPTIFGLINNHMIMKPQNVPHSQRPCKWSDCSATLRP